MDDARGGTRWVLCRGVAVRDETGRPVRMAGSQTDITEQRRIRDSLAQAARHDGLTDLPNRTLFSELLQRAIAQGARSSGHNYGVLFVDLDGFKLVNDSLGHVVGDRFLVAISQRLQGHLRPGDTLARLGGDEFAILAETSARRRTCARSPSGCNAPLQNRSRSTITSCSARRASASSSAGRNIDRSTRCCATPTSRCTREGGGPRRLRAVRSGDARVGAQAVDRRNRAAPRDRA